MTATDPFTAASPTYRNAIRHCARTGSPLEVSAPRLPSWKDLAALVVLIGFGWMVLTAAAVFSGGAW